MTVLVLTYAPNGREILFYLFEPGGTTNSSNERLFTVGVGTAEKVDVAVLFPSENRYV